VHYPSHWLSRDVYMCVTGDGVFFLDARQDRYVGVNVSSVPDLRRILHGFTSTAASCRSDRSTDSSRVVAALEATGLLTCNRDRGKPFEAIALEPVDIARSVSIADRRPDIHLGHACNFVIACLEALVALRLRSLPSLIARLKSGAAEEPLGFSADFVNRAEDLGAIFRWLRPFVLSSKDRCLFVSLALCFFMRRYHVYPTVVFGVATRPFRAHCWIQLGNVAFDVRPDRLGRYTPILAI